MGFNVRSSSISQDLLGKIARKPNVILTKADGTIYLGYCLPGTSGTGDKGWAIAKLITDVDPGTGDETVTELWASSNPDYYEHIFTDYDSYEYKFPV